MRKVDTKELEETVRLINIDANSEMYSSKNFATRYEALARKYPKFEKNFPAIFTQIIDKKDLQMIAYYISYINSINEGAMTLEEAEAEMAELFKKKFFSHIPDAPQK